MNRKFTIHKIVFIAILAALVFVVTFFRFPLMGSKVHFANAICLLSGLLMGPLPGGLAAFAADKDAKNHSWNIAACVVGAWTYVVLYMLKTFVYQKFVYGYPGDTVWAALLSKFPASAINAAAAMIVAPILYTALRPALQKAGLLDKIRS